MSSDLLQNQPAKLLGWEIKTNLNDMSQLKILLKQQAGRFAIETTFICKIINPETKQAVFIADLFQETKDSVQLKYEQYGTIDSVLNEIMTKLYAHRPRLPIGYDQESVQQLEENIITVISSLYLGSKIVDELKHAISQFIKEIESYKNELKFDPSSKSKMLSLMCARYELCEDYVKLANLIIELDPTQKKLAQEYCNLAEAQFDNIAVDVIYKLYDESEYEMLHQEIMDLKTKVFGASAPQNRALKF